MDEVATNTYDHRRMTIGSATDFGRAFQITLGGDGQMPFHIMLALTSCGNGIYNVPIDGISSGASHLLSYMQVPALHRS